MNAATREATTRSAAASATPTGALALALQEPFTAAVRLRSNRQVAADAASFRAHIKQLLATADREARQVGYTPEFIQLALYAFVAFLDEAVLNSTQPMFAEWPRQPLQEEVFGDHVAGENFFRYLDDLLAQQDSAELADLLEVFQLCLLLGFHGRYGLGNPGALESRAVTVREKIARIRGPLGALSPAWSLPAGEVIPTPRDPWVARLAVIAGVTGLLALTLFALFDLSLHAQLRDLAELVARLPG
jgi:type VI secretion system protein ImpK